MTDAASYREHASKIRRLVAGVRGHAATSALLLADEYELRAAELEGKPAAAAYLGHADRVGELIASERANINALIAEEADLAARLDRTRQQRAIAEARVDAMLLTARLLDMPDPARSRTLLDSARASQEPPAAANN